MIMKNKIKIRWISGLILLAVLYFVVFNLFINDGNYYFLDFFNCFLGSNNTNLSSIECASFTYQYVVIFLLLIFLTSIFVFSVYETERTVLENKHKSSSMLKLSGLIILISFFLFLIFFLMDMSFGGMVGLPPNDEMIGLPPQTRLSFLKISVFKSLIFSFFSTLFFFYIPSIIITNLKRPKT